MCGDAYCPSGMIASGDRVINLPAPNCVVVVPRSRFRLLADEPGFVIAAIAIAIADAPHPRFGFAHLKLGGTHSLLEVHAI